VKKYIETHNAHEPFEQDIWFSLPVVQKGDGRVMGLVSLVCKDHRQGPCGWALGVEYRGQGYATEAASGLLSYGFGTLGLHRISGRHHQRKPRLLEADGAPGDET
jgi:RimJ/RimL family protein N-acetyltransferase